MIMMLDKKCKHSIRYAQGDKNQGPLTVYIPNEWFQVRGLDLNNPPQKIDFKLEERK